MPGDYELNERATAKQTTVSKDQKSSGFGGNIRDAVISDNPDAYKEYFEMTDTPTPDGRPRTIPLNSSLGTELADRGYVMSFSVGGSSYAQPVRYEKGMGGKNNILVKDPEGNIKRLRKGKAGKIYRFRDQRGETEVRGEDIAAFAREQVTRVYGKRVYTGKKKKDIREKIDGNKTKYSIAGPKYTYWFGKHYGGLMNIGEYTMEKTRDEILKLGEKRLLELMELPDFNDPEKEINFTFSGHSRGAVGAVQGAMKLKHLINTRYEKLKDRVHFNILLYDPVPGPKSRIKSNVNHVINLKEQTREMKEAGMDPLDAGDHSTVMYSMGCNHMGDSFAPTKIMGADTIILTGHSHKSGIKDTEQQPVAGSLTGETETKRMAYINAENKQAYRASGLCKMPPGVFIADENDILTRVRSTDTIESVYEKAYTNTDLIDHSRKLRIIEVSTDVIVRNGGQPTISSVRQALYNHDPFYIRSSREFGLMRAEFEKLDKLMTAREKDETLIADARFQIRRHAMDYITAKQSMGPHSNLTQARINVAKNMLRCMDRDVFAELKWPSGQPADNTPKSEDIRDAYIRNCSYDMRRNAGYIVKMAEDCRSGYPVDTDMVIQSLSSMLADRYFLEHKDTFMPKPLDDLSAQKKIVPKLDELLGSEGKSLYDTFRNSRAVQLYAREIFNADAVSLYSDPEAVKLKLDSVILKVSEEILKDKKQPAAARENAGAKLTADAEKAVADDKKLQAVQPEKAAGLTNSQHR